MSWFLEDFDPWLLLPNKIAVSSDTIPSSMSTSTTCGSQTADIPCRDDAKALQLKMIAITAILVSGIAGVSLPFLCRKNSGTGGCLSILKAFAAGVILATGFVHMLHDANEALSDPCLPASPWGHFPFPGFIAMLASLATLAVDSLVTQLYQHKHKDETLLLKSGRGASVAVEVPFVVDNRGVSAASELGYCNGDERMHIVGIRAHAHASRRAAADSTLSIDRSVHSQARHVVVSQILELGIVSHSVIIGLSLGVSRSPCTIRPLVAALSFHQFFEGLALGGCIAQAQFKNFSAFMMACFFAITTPSGIGIGAAISSSYNPYSPEALIVEGVLDSVSAGILIYMSLVDLIAADFQRRTVSSNAGLLFSLYLALFIGAGMMSSLAIWA